MNVCTRSNCKASSFLGAVIWVEGEKSVGHPLNGVWNWETCANQESASSPDTSRLSCLFSQLTSPLPWQLMKYFHLKGFFQSQQMQLLQIIPRMIVGHPAFRELRIQSHPWARSTSSFLEMGWFGIDQLFLHNTPYVWPRAGGHTHS